MTAVKRSIGRAVATTAMLSALAAIAPTVGSAAAAKFYVGEFKGRPQAVIAFKATKTHVQNLWFRVAMDCSPDPNTQLVSGFGGRELKDGSFKVTRKPASDWLIRVKGSGFPGTPVGTLRARIGTSRIHKDCRTGLTSWSASRVTVKQWRHARR